MRRAWAWRDCPTASGTHPLWRSRPPPPCHSLFARYALQTVYANGSGADIAIDGHRAGAPRGRGCCAPCLLRPWPMCGRQRHPRPSPRPRPPPPPCPCAGNMANLFTNLNMGLGTRPFASGGAGTRGAHFGACAVSAGGRVPPEGRTRARRSRPACLVACRPQQHVLEPLLDHQADPGPPHLRLWAVPQLCGVLLGQPGVAPLRTCQAACAPPHAHPHLHLTC